MRRQSQAKDIDSLEAQSFSPHSYNHTLRRNTSQHVVKNWYNRRAIIVILIIMFVLCTRSILQLSVLCNLHDPHSSSFHVKVLMSFLTYRYAILDKTSYAKDDVANAHLSLSNLWTCTSNICNFKYCFVIKCCFV